MDKVGGYKNYGYGKQLFYAGKQALLDRYGEERYSTRHSHAERWRLFANFLKAKGINDTRKVTLDMIEQYAAELRDKVDNKKLAVSTAQNRLSTVNVILQTMRKDTVLNISPRQWVGERQHIRQTIPTSLQLLPDQSPSDNNAVNTFFNQVIQQLNASGQQRLSILVQLTKHLDLRFREASLFNAVKAQLQAEKFGKVNITEGTKGGRGKSVDRWIPVDEAVLKIIRQAANLQKQDKNNNLIPKNKTFTQWENYCRYQWRKANQTVIKQLVENLNPGKEVTSIKGFHDMRAAYACLRYQEITGYPAPILNPQQQRTAPKQLDREARQILAKELGHNRPSVLGPYIGSAK